MARVYSEEYKHEAARKFHSRGRKPVAEIANELGISSPTLYEWGRKHAILDGMKKTTQRSPRIGRLLKSFKQFLNLND